MAGRRGKKIRRQTRHATCLKAGAAIRFYARGVDAPDMFCFTFCSRISVKLK